MLTLTVRANNQREENLEASLSPRLLAGPSAFDRTPRNAQRSMIHFIPGIITRTGNRVPVSPIQDNSVSARKLHQTKSAGFDLNMLVSRVEERCGDESIPHFLRLAIHWGSRSRRRWAHSLFGRLQHHLLRWGFLAAIGIAGATVDRLGLALREIDAG
jgi:hypothetical protein